MDTLTAPLRITIAFDILPALNGILHAVDYDPDVQFDSYPVSLCGVALQARGAVIADATFCETCMEESRQRQAAFDLEYNQ